MIDYMNKLIAFSFDDLSFPKGWANKSWWIDLIPKLWTTIDYRDYALIGLKIHLTNASSRGKVVRFRISFINKLKVHLSFQFGKDIIL